MASAVIERVAFQLHSRGIGSCNLDARITGFNTAWRRPCACTINDVVVRRDCSTHRINGGKVNAVTTRVVDLVIVNGQIEEGRGVGMN